MNLRRCKAATVSAGAISAGFQCKCTGSQALRMRLPAGQGRRAWCLDGLAGRSRRARAPGG